jgi:hypothetical protein
MSMALAFVALAAAAQATTAAPAAKAAPTAPAATSAAKPKSDGDQCADAKQSSNEREIVICAQRPNGYRLNPDIMEAKRELKKGAPAPPLGRYSRPDCATVGPIPCTSAGINLVGAALAAATMVEKAVKGEDVGQMFVTDPHPDEYHLYLMAKARREQEQAEAAAKKSRAEAQAKAQAKGASTTADPPSVDGK